jgi:hypothetical protein
MLKAYPSQADAILHVKSLREKIDSTMAGIDLPEIRTTYRELDDFSAFVPLLVTSCASVWKDMTGSDPDFDMADALKASARGKNAADIASTKSDLLQAIIYNSFSRLLHMLREKFTYLIPESWTGGDCPFCGAYPRIGFDAEDKRTLHCLSCGHSWRYPRLKCPSCGNSDYHTQGYFEAEGLEGFRVYFCRECKNYLKIVDIRARDTNDPETEDSLTLELDDLALKEGFTEEGGGALKSISEKT